MHSVDAVESSLLYFRSECNSPSDSESVVFTAFEFSASVDVARRPWVERRVLTDLLSVTRDSKPKCNRQKIKSSGNTKSNSGFPSSGIEFEKSPLRKAIVITSGNVKCNTNLENELL
eukprot:c20386_g1_i1.p2 GENE.c20386_g1_i1~~c20386_g1_i1.p2  ORF type:complete len:117 (+),score=18.70 c20386_g1_i1:130-480(+)